MPKRRQPFTKKQHATLGRVLSAFRDRILARAICELSASYGPNSRETRAEVSALNSIDRLRCILDDRGLPKMSARFEPQNLYYLSAERRAAAAQELNIDWGTE